jgi:hypothetical protein
MLYTGADVCSVTSDALSLGRLLPNKILRVPAYWQQELNRTRSLLL